MTKRRKKKRGQRGLWNKRLTPEEEVEQREAAFAAIRQLYAESLPLWRSCQRIAGVINCATATCGRALSGAGHCCRSRSKIERGTKS
jgi:hypothetical protein